jgi:hypothetical protein
LINRIIFTLLKDNPPLTRVSFALPKTPPFLFKLLIIKHLKT